MAQLAAVRAAKQELRKNLRPLLSAMTEAQRGAESEVLCRKFLESEEYKASRRISVYLSMLTEVNTVPILEDIFATGRICFVPRFEGPNMDMLSVHSMDDVKGLPRTKWNIQQPEAGDQREEALATGGLDLLLVPGLGFTKEGHRLGRGKGYYDSFFAKCAQVGLRPKTVALAFSVQLCDSIPMTEKDLIVDRVILPHA